MHRKYGWIKDKKDPRDFKYSAIKPIDILLLPSTDLRPSCPPVFDQSNLGSCTAEALAGAVDYIHKGFLASRLFIYYNERAIEGTVDSDSGAEIRDGIKTLASDGVCAESEWPYNISDFTQKPLLECYEDAKKDVISSYHSINGLEEMKSCLCEGFPFVFGFSVYESFESDKVAKDGIVPLPKSNEQFLGGHAVMAVGYDDSKKYFIVRNSWGSNWGVAGYFYIPYKYLTDPSLASDMWTLRA